MAGRKKDYAYYESKVTAGDYTSMGILRRSMGRSILPKKQKEKLLEYAASILPESAPHKNGRTRLLSPPSEEQGEQEEGEEEEEEEEITSGRRSLASRLQAGSTIDESGDATVSYLVLEKKDYQRYRLNLLINILNGPSRGDVMELLHRGVESGVVHASLNEEMEALARLIPVPE